MATKYAIGNDASIVYDGDGTLPTPATSEGGPGAYKLPPSNAFTADDWFLVPGAVLDFGAVRPTATNNTKIKMYGGFYPGSGAKPIIRSSHASGVLNASTAYGTEYEDIVFDHVGSIAGDGINASSVTNTVNPGPIVRRCDINGSLIGIKADLTYTLKAVGNTIRGSSSTIGIRGTAGSGLAEAVSWEVSENTFIDLGNAVKIVMSDIATGAPGKYTNLKINRNIIDGCAGIGINVGCLLVEDNYTPTASMVETAGPTFTMTRQSTAWHAGWAAGMTVFLAGWGQPGNFGRVTIASRTSPTQLVVTPLDGQTLVAESAAIGKGFQGTDDVRRVTGLECIGNKFYRLEQTPMLLAAINGESSPAVADYNEFYDTRCTAASTSACIEIQGALKLVCRGNYGSLMSGTYEGDGVGIFFDGASDKCEAYGNYFEDFYITGSAGTNNLARSGVASFYSRDCVAHHNIAVRCRRGWSAGGMSPGFQTYNNTSIDCDIGGYINSSPGVNGNTITDDNNFHLNCDIGVSDFSPSAVTRRNSHLFGCAINNGNGSPTVVPGTGNVYTDPLVTSEGRPKPGSPLLTGGADLGYVRDFDGKQGKKFVGAYTAATLLR